MKNNIVEDILAKMRFLEEKMRDLDNLLEAEQNKCEHDVVISSNVYGEHRKFCSTCRKEWLEH